MLSTIASAVTGTSAPGADDLTVERRNNDWSSSSNSVPTGKKQLTTRDGATQTSDHGFKPTDSYSTPNTAMSPATVTKQSFDPHHLRRAEPHNLPGHPIPGLPKFESAGAAAASLAHSAPKPVAAWKLNPTSAASAAASLAHANREAGSLQNSSSVSRIGSDLPSQGSKGNWSLHGARGAMNAEGNRRRADSSPVGLYSEEDGAVTLGTRRNSGFITSPEDEVSAQTRQKSDILTAATVSMANDRLKREEVFQSPPRRPHEDVSPPQANTPVPRRQKYPNLEEAARRQAEERLARIGYIPASRSVTSGRTRSVSLSSSPPRPQRYDIRELDEDTDRVDRRKRGQDALLLMSTARKNVQTRLSEQDRQIAESRVMRKDWLPKATEIAQRQSDQRMQRTQNHGKVAIGGGAYMTQEEIDMIAERNVRPVIDDINERAGEHHQLKRERREEKTREMARRLDEADKKLFGFRRRHGIQVEGGSREESPRPTRDGQEKDGDGDGNLGRDLASPTNENRVRGREENDRTEGRTTLLGKITGRNRTRSSSESRGAINSIGVVRGHMVQKTRIDRTVDYAGDDARSAGAPGEVTAVTADNQTALVGTDTEVAHPTSSGSGGREGSRNSLLGYLKRPFVRHTPPTSGQATALGATGNRGGISSDFFDRIRGGRAEPPEREKPVRDAVDKVVVVDVETEEITTGPQNEPVTVKTEEHTVVNVRGAETETSIKEEESSHEIFIDTREGIAPPVINIPAKGEVVVQTTVTKTVTTIEETSSKDVPRDIRNENGEIPTGTTTGETSEGYVPGPATSNRTPAKDPLPEEVTSGSTKGNEKADLQFTSGDITTRNTTEINEEAGEGSRHQGIGFSHVVTNRNTFEGDEDQELRGKLDGDVPIARESKFHEEL